MKLYLGILIACCIAGLTGCKKTETYTPVVSMNDVNPLAVGHTYFYRLDSTVTTNFGLALGTRSYNAKDSIESTFTDNAGRPSFRVFRYIRDTFNVQPWQYIATYYVTVDANRIETVDNNNLRFVSLINPVSDGGQWPGTQYIDLSPPNDFYQDWTFEYQNIGQPYDVKKGTFDETYTVLQRDETRPDGPFNPSNPLSQRFYSIEIYAKGVGLIYKDFLHWEYQNNGSSSKYDDDSYGIRLSLMDYK